MTMNMLVLELLLLLILTNKLINLKTNKLMIALGNSQSDGVYVGNVQVAGGG